MCSRAKTGASSGFASEMSRKSASCGTFDRTYQTPFAQRIREEAEIMTGAVGLITSPVRAERIIATGEADAILMAREFLRDSYWPLHAAGELNQSIS